MKTEAEISVNTVWRELARATVDRRHPWRVVGLCTQGAEGPTARSVILRKVMPDGRSVLFFTDRRTEKMKAIDACPRVALLMWDAHHRRQLRMTGCAAPLADVQALERHWATVPEAARRDYASLAPPGSPHTMTDTRSVAEVASAAREHFAVLQVQVDQMEWLELGREAHRRVEFRWCPETVGWLAQALNP